MLSQIISDILKVSIVDLNHLEQTIGVEIVHRFALNTTDHKFDSIYLSMSSELAAILPLRFFFIPDAMNSTTGIIVGGIILVGMYVLIVFEICQRCFAAILASTVALATLTILERKPTMHEILSWIDAETILLLFSMMILVAIFSQTGIFDYLAVYAYEITSGRIWPLISYLALFTVILSMFLDNVTTILLMTPVIIRICEVVQLNPIQVLTVILIFCNIGGIATPVGDPPNLMIISNSYIGANVC